MSLLNLRQNAGSADRFTHSESVMSRGRAHPFPTTFATSSPILAVRKPNFRATMVN